MIPGQITVPPPEPPAPVRYECSRCNAEVVRLGDDGMLIYPCGHEDAGVRAYVAAVINVPLTSHFRG